MPRTFINSGTSTSDATSYNWGNFNAATAGLMVVGAVGRSGSSVSTSTCSIGGTNGTIHQDNGGSVTNTAAVCSRAVSSGNNNVTVSYSTTCLRAGVGVWLLTDLVSNTPSGGDAASAAGATSVGVTLDIPANGVAIYAHGHANTNLTTWSDAIERLDTAVEATSVVSVADAEVGAAQTGHTETASWTGSQSAGLAGASWQFTSAPPFTGIGLTHSKFLAPRSLVVS